ncbi:hypothetical protein [Leifsonia sp. Leaf264]|uniref:hypothetical protein n=1 Tax=Leifsonia sp. Leaf264 TaxID=1736314 RepID=UPI0006FEFA2C|nr:hypothetical protein [Leifsonia sp. Leaf264]KQO98123.1 hypothetical protein ASF30_08485 [Leifsonia sp. Leaf264]
MSAAVIIYAIHTPDPSGAPMNETAYCAEHLHQHDNVAHGLLAAADADDAPENPEYTIVARPENNDTVCNDCGATGAGN